MKSIKNKILFFLIILCIGLQLNSIKVEADTGAGDSGDITGAGALSELGENI